MSGDAPSRGLIDTNILILLGALEPDELPEEMVISAVKMELLRARRLLATIVQRLGKKNSNTGQPEKASVR